MKIRIATGKTALAAAFAAPFAAAFALPQTAGAQSSSPITYYSPPSLVKRGTNTTPIAGSGTVVVQVMVNKDGTFKVTHVIHSTNSGDDAAALEIAKTSTYKAASRGAVKQAAFYDFTLKFTSSGKTADSDTGGAAGTAQYERMLRAGNYSGAQSGLRAYVAQHPDDTKAQQDLGVASMFLNDDEDAVAAFDKGGTISPEYKSVATNAYAQYATAALKNNQYDAAVAAAKKAVALQPGLYTYNALGTAEAGAGQNDAAIADLEKARSLGTSSKASERAVVDANLASAYLNAGKPDQAKQIAAEATQLDPTATGIQTVFANYYVKQAQSEQSAGKNADAAASFEQAAAAAPSEAAVLYTRAAFAYLSAQPKPDPENAKTDADKALALKPDDAAANYAAGIALADQPGKSKDALTFLNKADTLAKSGNDQKLTDQIENAIKQLGDSSK